MRIKSVGILSQSSVETIDSKGFNSGDRKLLDILVSMADCCLQESATSGDISGHFNITIIEEECTGPTTPIFFPLSLYYRKQIAEIFNISNATVGRMSIESTPSITCMKNYIQKHVVGDGNCFFRAISFLITGCDSSRNKICVHLVVYIVEKANWDCLKQYVPTKYKSGLQHVNDIKMAFFGEWNGQWK